MSRTTQSKTHKAFMSYSKVILWMSLLLLAGCASKHGVVIPPNGGAAITVKKPVWISGIHVNELKYSASLPEPEENQFLKVVNAGYWLANTNVKISQLVYTFDLTNKKVFPQDKVYTSSSFTNPEDKTKPIVYTGTLDNTMGSTHITHATVNNVQMNEEYILKFNVYSDPERTQLITSIHQKIVSPVDNTNGCIKLSHQYMQEVFGYMRDPQGKPIPVEKLMINCVRY